MSIWGKVIGGAMGFALGGPLGALVGAVAGHAVDQMRRPDAQAEGPAASSDATRQIGFTIGVIVLGAKMAKADGHVTRDEIAVFKQVFRIPPEEEKNVAWLFDRARRDSEGFEPYARQIARMLRGHPAVLEELVDCLFYIAEADGSVHPAELEYLRRVAEILDVEEVAFERIRAAHLEPDETDPYRILGLERSASDTEIKSAYYRLSRENHPDLLVADGMPPEFIDVANGKMAAINTAYDQVAKERGLK